MKTNTDELSAHFALLADDELLHQSKKDLTSEARLLVDRELRSRGMPVPDANDRDESPADANIPNSFDAGPKWVNIAQFQDLVEAHLLKGYLENLDIPALVTGVDVARTFSNVLGGSRLDVPSEFVARAREIVENYRSSEAPFEGYVRDDADVQSDDPPERGLKTYRVYAHAKRKTLVVVKTGYCWAALVFGPLWFLLNKMWANALIFIALIVGNSLYVAHAAPVDAMDAWIYDVMTLLYPIAWFLFSLFANRLLCADLESKGYVLHTTTMARSPAYARDAARKATGIHGHQMPTGQRAWGIP